MIEKGLHMTERKTMNRRHFIKRGLKVFLSLLGTGTIIGTYSVTQERFWYQIKEVHLKIRNLPKSFDGWKIVQFSDVHFGFHYGVEDLYHVVSIINDLAPDILFFTGDLVQTGYPHPDIMVPPLQKLKTPRGGKWAVLGNHDYVFQYKIIKSLQDSDFTVLQNNHGRINLNGQSLYIAGMDDALYGRPDPKEALSGLTNQDCVLLLAHEPDVANWTYSHGFSAQFSGHSHGGQVRLPFFGPVISQELARKYNDGLYYVGENKMPLYVNRGIGTTQLPLRFFCRPEITVFYLYV